VVAIEPPRAKLRVDRNGVPEVLASLLARCPIEDITVEDPPLEEVIAEVFTQAGSGERLRGRVASDGGLGARG
jgi:ABC-2 type transport system ATP-binding protein